MLQVPHGDRHGVVRLRRRRRRRRAAGDAPELAGIHRARHPEGAAGRFDIPVSAVSSVCSAREAGGRCRLCRVRVPVFMPFSGDACPQEGLVHTD